MRPLDDEEMAWLVEYLRQRSFTRNTVLRKVQSRQGALLNLGPGLGRACAFTYDELALAVAHLRMIDGFEQ